MEEPKSKKYIKGTPYNIKEIPNRDYWMKKGASTWMRVVQGI
jgi:hypothetical protein